LNVQATTSTHFAGRAALASSSPLLDEDVGQLANALTPEDLRAGLAPHTSLICIAVAFSMNPPHPGAWIGRCNRCVGGLIIERCAADDVAVVLPSSERRKIVADTDTCTFAMS